MRVIAIDHGTVRMGIAISDELKMIAQPWVIPAEPFSSFLDRFKCSFRSTRCWWRDASKHGWSYGEASIKVREFELF